MEKVEKEKIDMTPTWQGVVPIYLNILETHGGKTKRENIIALNIARKEMAHMAEVADRLLPALEDARETEMLCVQSMERLIYLIDNPESIKSENNQKILTEVKELIKKFKDENKPDSDQGLAEAEA